MMKQAIIILFTLLALSSAAWAVKGPQRVEFTPHNFSSSADDFYYAQYKASNEDRICIFCHTPHGGNLDGPLWNRYDSNLVYTHYNSDTLSSVIKDDINRVVNDESLICMSCHDGTLGVGDIINRGNAIPENNDDPVVKGFDFRFGVIPGPQLGASWDDLNSNIDLRDDHPISFSYAAVYAEKPSDFNPVADVEVDLLLFNNRVECSTCHDPHVNYAADLGFAGADIRYKPFLRMPNNGSAMCLTCHIK